MSGILFLENFQDYFKQVIKKIKNSLSRRETHGTVRQFQLKKEFNRERIFTGEIVRYNSHKNQRPPYDAKNPFYAKVAINKELHKGGNRSCMHIELDIKDSRIR